MSATEIDMYDAIDAEVLPGGALAYAAYVGGAWPTYAAVRARFPAAWILSIAVNAAEAAECLDIENGDATVDEAPGWNARAHARGVKLPKNYASVSVMAGLAETLAAAGIRRSQVLLWSAHYGAGRHICGPSTCAYRDGRGRMVPQCDGTQWTDQAGGANVDASVLAADFFTRAAAPPAAAVPATEDDMYQGQITVAAPASVPVVLGTTDRACLFADWTTKASPLSVRVAVWSKSKGYSQVTDVVLNDSGPHYVLFEQKDVAAVSFRRNDTDATRTAGFFIAG